MGTPNPLSPPGLDAIPAETPRSTWLGAAVHLGPPVAFVAAIALGGDTGARLALVLGAFFAVSTLSLIALLAAEKWAPCIALPRPAWREVLAGLVLVFVTGAFLGGVAVLSVWWATSSLADWLWPAAWRPGVAAEWPWPRIALAVLLTDAGYYAIHRWVHHGSRRFAGARWFRDNHRVHHRVEHLDFLRGNVSSVVDTALTGFQVPLGLLAAGLSLDLEQTLVAYFLVLMLQATHHVNHTFNIGVLRYVLMDNHAHKLHHCGRGQLVNHGALFSIWDRLLGTYYEDWRLSANHLHHLHVPLPRAKTARAS